MKKQKENSHEGITWSEMGKQNVQAEKVYYTKTIIRLRLVNIGEYSPRLRLGEYSPIFTSPSANNC